MKAIFDLRSFLIGAVLTVFVFLALGAARNDSPQAGRFQIEANNNYVFVIDTATGQVWEKFAVAKQDTKSQNFMDPKLLLDKK